MNHHVFSFSRFGHLVRLHWEGYRKRYLLAVPALAGLMLAWESFNLFLDNYSPLDDGMQAWTYYWGLALVGCFYGSTIFAEFGSKAQGIAWLAVPASALEKLLCGLLFSVVLCFVLYTAVYYLLDIPLVGLANRLIVGQHRLWPAGGRISPNRIFNILDGMPGEPLDKTYHIWLMTYLALQSAYVLGSVYFNRFGFVKTTVAVLLCIMVFTVLEKGLHIMMPAGWNWYPPVQNWIRDSETIRVQSVRLSPWITGLLAMLLVYGVPLVLWSATYFRLKEKEV